MSNNIEPLTFSIEEAFRCLEVTYSKTSKSDDINQAQNRLMQYDLFLLENIKLFLEGIAIKDKYSENLKLSALIFLKNSIEGKIKRKSLNEEQIWTIIKILIDFLIHSDLSDKIINAINNILQNLFNWKNILKDFAATVDLCRMIGNYIKNHIDQNPNDDESFNLGNFKRLVSLMQMIYATKSVNENNLNEILELTLDIIDMVLVKNQKIISFLLPKISNANVIIPKVLLDLLFLMTIKIKDYKNSYQKLEILINRYANTCLHFILDQTIPNNNLIIYITENEELDKVLNLIKAKSFQFLSSIIQYGTADITDSTLKEICYNLIDLIIKNLNFLVENNLFNLENYDKNLEILFYHIFLFLSRCLNREPILSNFVPHVKKFIVHTLLPYMIASEKEKIKMKTDGLEYQCFILDIIGDHKSKHSRTSVDFLIVRICDKYDGLAFFLVNFFIQIIDFAINCSDVKFDNNTIIPEAYDLLNNEDLGFKSLFNIFNQESLIDVSIILLCSLKTFIVKNKSLSIKLKNIFDFYINKLHMAASDLIKFDLCLIYDIYALPFLEEAGEQTNDLEILNKRLDYLFICLMNYEKNPGTSSQSAKAITNILERINKDILEQKFISNIFSQLILHIESIEISIFFDVIINIIEICRVEENLIQVISFTTNRILKEIKSTKFDDKSNTVIYSKCLNIIKTIIQENSLVQKEQIENDVIIPIVGNTLDIDDLEGCLLPLMNYLKNPNKIKFEEDLLEILKNILSNSKSVTPLSKELFGHLSKSVEKIGGIDILLFKIFDLYITKDDGFIFNNENNMKYLLGLILKALEPEEDFEFSPICSCILLQILPNNKSNVLLPEKFIVEIIETIIEKINELNQEYVNQYNAMNGTIDMHLMISYLSTIYSYFIKYPEITFRICVEKNALECIIQLTDLICYFKYYSTNQSKIIILGICAILSNEQILLQIKNLFNKILAQLFTLLFRQKNEESKKMKQMLNKEFDCNFVDSDNEEDEENSEGEEDFSEANTMD